MKQSTQNGNALIFILIAIALLGLLTVSLSKSSGDSNDTGSFEQNQIAASEILTYAKGIENAVQSLLARGCSENEISFQNAVVAGYSNTSSPTDNSCHIFEPEGTGITYNLIKEVWLNSTYSAQPYYNQWQFEANHCVIGVASDSTNCVSDSSKELILSLIFLKKDLCMLINKSLGVTNPGNQPPIDATTPSNDFTGIFGPAGNGIMGDDAAELIAKKSGCYQDDAVGFSGNAYIFYHVLIAR
jgi:type II secretory pathway pseudopilin PulG